MLGIEIYQFVTFMIWEIWSIQWIKNPDWNFSFSISVPRYLFNRFCLSLLGTLLRKELLYGSKEFFPVWIQPNKQIWC